MDPIRTVLTRRYGTPLWDFVIRMSGVLALIAILLNRIVPAAGGLISFVVVTIWVNGPLAPFLPATYEPILMAFGQIYPPVVVASLGIAGTLSIEFVNYYLYGKLVHLEATRRLRENVIVRKTVKLFERAPFFTVWLCSWSLLPYWAIRVVAPLAGYPIGKYLLATFLGRFPRLWFFAALGQYLQISIQLLAAVTVGAILIGVLVLAPRSRRAPPATEMGAAD
jgi:uncharacterized membrane protein YdjX (TVP38/TMEM64 family)